MSYNVENLFDSSHDEGKLDYTYLPISEKYEGSDAYKYCRSLRWNYAWMRQCFNLDWTYDVFYKKLKNIAEVVRSYRDGAGPDIVLFQEVEKIEILRAMVDKELSGLGYATVVLVEGDDKRGIDIGLISRFPLASEPILHPVDLRVLSADSLVGVQASGPTRGILEVNLNIDGRLVTVLGNHWPSPASKPITRMIAARNLKLILESKPEGSLVIAAGDFNVVESENPNPFRTHLLAADPKGYLLDIYSECLVIDGFFCSYPPGTAYFKGWDRLDRIFFSDSFLKDEKVAFAWANFVVYAPEFMVDKKHRPLRYNPKTGKGYSDHLPVVMEFQVN